MKKKIVFFVFILSTISYSQKTAILEDGTKIIIYSDKTWQYESEINSSKHSISDSSKILININSHENVYVEPRYKSKTIENFPEKNIEALDYVDNYIKVKSPDGRIGYVIEYYVKDFSECIKKINSRIISQAHTEGLDLLMRNVKLDDINSANGVDFSIEWIYTALNKTIKYIYFTVVPYNRVGDIQTCQISGRSSFTGKVTGPIGSETPFQKSSWETAWYNNTINCIKLSKVEVEYTNGSRYTYIKELPQILDKSFKNSCK